MVNKIYSFLDSKQNSSSIIYQVDTWLYVLHLIYNQHNNQSTIVKNKIENQKNTRNPKILFRNDIPFKKLCKNVL